MALRVVKKQERDTPKSEVEILREQIEQLQKENEELKSKKTTSKKVEKKVEEYPFDIYLETDHYINIPRQLVHDLTDVKSSLALSIYVALKDAEYKKSGKAQISLESLAHLARSTPKTVKEVIRERLSKYVGFKNGHSTKSSTYYFKKLEGTEIKLTPESTLYSKIERDLFKIKEGKQVCKYPRLFDPRNKKKGIHLKWIREDNGGDKNFVLNPKYHYESGRPKNGFLTFEQLQEMLKKDFGVGIVEVGEKDAKRQPDHYEIDVKDDEFKSTICATYQGDVEEKEFKVYPQWISLAEDLIETLNYESMETQRQFWTVKGVPYTYKYNSGEVEVKKKVAPKKELNRDDYKGADGNFHFKNRITGKDVVVTDWVVADYAMRLYEDGYVNGAPDDITEALRQFAIDVGFEVTITKV